MSSILNVKEQKAVHTIKEVQEKKIYKENEAPFLP